MTINWFGLPYHPTDSYIDWRDRDRVEKAEKLRAAYNKIVAFGLEAELKTIVDAAYEQGKLDELDANAGPDM